MSFLQPLIPFIPEIIGAGASLIGSSKQNKSLNNANAGYQNAVDQSTAYYKPFYDAGVGGLNRLNALTDPNQSFDATQADPSYQWRLGQGINAMDRSAAAKHTLYSGGYAKDLADYGQGQASTEYQNIFNRNATLANYGANAANGFSQALFKGAEGQAPIYSQQGQNSQDLWGGLGGIATNAFNKLNLGGGSSSYGAGGALSGLQGLF